MDTPDDIDATVAAALDTAPSETPPPENETPPAETSVRELAELEEKVAAARIRAAKDNAEEASKALPVADADEPMIQTLAKGREYLEQKMREHAAKPKVVYVPPPLTEGMRTKIEEEQEAGRRAVEKHALQQANRPQPARDPKEGFTTPVYRPGDVVPDPKLGIGSGFAAGTKKFSPDA